MEVEIATSEMAVAAKPEVTKWCINSFSVHSSKFITRLPVLMSPKQDYKLSRQ